MVIEEKKQVRKLVVYTQPILSLIDKIACLPCCDGQAKVEQACVYNRKLFNCSVSKEPCLCPERARSKKLCVRHKHGLTLSRKREDGLFAHQADKLAFVLKRQGFLPSIHKFIHKSKLLKILFYFLQWK
jgi:hypothetical protein